MQAAEPVAGRFSARFVDGGAAVSNDGGASAAALPHDGFAVVPTVKASVPPLATKDSGSHARLAAAPLTVRLCT